MAKLGVLYATTRITAMQRSGKYCRLWNSEPEEAVNHMNRDSYAMVIVRVLQLSSLL